jgi:hypothetical protein
VDTAGERVGAKMTCRSTDPLTSNLGLAEVDEKVVTFTFNLRFPVDKTEDDMLTLLKQKMGPEGYEVSDPSSRLSLTSLTKRMSSWEVEHLIRCTNMYAKAIYELAK